ncbi:hypothetical protein C1701_19535 [Actinoalloteichus sp. AHMU CJ021]|uniref:hypothetical protein n=1 Tax=Actinoalloteichus TaxID=65496 RepID=UPI0004AB24C5|nr:MULTISPECIES: hypothetical protein [Actinoalloteichus]AUS80158.1 hypothetical protein C1701_19535 [Actinoalloteichus sp. AHMU CJ021]
MVEPSGRRRFGAWALVRDPENLAPGTRVRVHYNRGLLSATVLVGDLIACGEDMIRLSGSHLCDLIAPRVDGDQPAMVERWSYPDEAPAQ